MSKNARISIKTNFISVQNNSQFLLIKLNKRIKT